MRRAVLAGVLAASLAACGPAPQPLPAASEEPLVGIAPSGDAQWPLVFRWEGAGDDAVVRVRVLDEAERPLFGIEARGQQVPAPAALQRLLEPGERYGWRVARVDENGETVGTSDLVTFVFR